ncbi:MAG: cytochrome b [Pseudomonadota bacterium]|nr:cytochrome b [Pseudomonadota bacterium]
MALLLVGMVSLGWYMMSIEEETGSDWYFNLHKSIGLIVLTLVVLRILWRLPHTPQKLPSQVPRWQTTLASITQTLLYVCMVVIPVAGLTGSLYSKHGLAFFGIALPHPVANHDLSEQLFSIHGIAVWVLVGLVSLHVAGALKHLLIDRDGVFQRMWPKAK